MSYCPSVEVHMWIAISAEFQTPKRSWDVRRIKTRNRTENKTISIMRTICSKKHFCYHLVFINSKYLYSFLKAWQSIVLQLKNTLGTHELTMEPNDEWSLFLFTMDARPLESSPWQPRESSNKWKHLHLHSQ